MKRLVLFSLIAVCCVLSGEGSAQERLVSCSIYPTELDFGTIRVGLTKELYFTIANTGGEALSGVVTVACQDYFIASGGGSYTLNPGQSRIVTIRFAPSSLGTKPCTVETGNGGCSDVSCMGMGDIAPVCSVQPALLHFGRVDEGYWGDRSFTISNAGGGTLTGSVSASCEEFTLLSGAGPYSLTAGQSRTVTVRLQPTSLGVKNCTVETGTACADVQCTGISGVLPACSVDPESLDFGTVFIGAAADHDFTITNIGGGTLDGTVTAACEEYTILSGGGAYSLGAGQSRTVTVRFAPDAAGPADCTLETGDALCTDVSCFGIGEPLPVCSLSTLSLDFDTVFVGDVLDLYFTITNTGGGTLNGGVSASCEAFSILSGDGPYSLEAGQTWTITVRCAPASRGSSFCTIETGSELCDDVTCSAVGEIPPSCSISPLALDFGTVLLGDSLEDGFTITNTGGMLLEGEVSAACEGYRIVSGVRPYSLGAGESWSVTVRFVPAVTGSSGCVIETGVDLCDDVPCTGKGDIDPACSVSPTSLSFGRVDVGECEDQSFTVTNTGGGTLSGAVGASCTNFHVVAGEGSYTLAAGETLTVTVRFAPISTGDKSCTIETGSDLCADVFCHGTGGNIPLCSVYPGELDFGTVLVGLSVDLAFTIANTGGGVLSGTVSESCPEYLILSGSGSYELGSGASRIVTIRFAPLSVGGSSCTIGTGGTGCSDVICTGAGDIPSPCDVDPVTLDFGVVMAGNSVDRSFVIKNYGDEVLNGNVRASCPDFSLLSGGGSFNLEKNESQTVTVRFAPTSMGGRECIIETGNGLCDDVTCWGMGDFPPVCSVDPVSLEFDTVLVGGAPVDLTFTITNTGGGILNGGVSEYCPDFSLVSGSGVYALGAGQSRAVTVRFSPTDRGSTDCTIETGTVFCSDITCTGTGETLPECTVEPTVLDFGTVLLGDSAPLDFSITNTGGGILHENIAAFCEAFSLTPDAGSVSLGAGESMTVTVTFAPVIMGNHACTVLIEGLCTNVTCAGIGDQLPACFVEPESLDFGSILLGESEDLDFTITNTGGGTMSGSVGEFCSNFSLISGEGPYALGSGQSWTVTVRYTPVSEGSDVCTVETGNDACDDVICSGGGYTSSVCTVEPESLDFGTVLVGTSQMLTFTIANSGNQTLDGAVSFSCVDFIVISGGGSFSLSAGQVQTVTVNFAPTTEGVKECVMETGNDDCGTVICSGAGEIVSECTVEPESLDFGTILVGTSQMLTFTIANSGGQILEGAVSFSCADFNVISGGGSFSLSAGQAQTVTVNFAPTTEGVKECLIETGNDDCGGVICSGVGEIFPECTVEPASLDFDTVRVGESSDLTFTITNTGGGILSGEVNEACDAYTLLSGAGEYNLEAGETLIVTVSFAPSAVGESACVIYPGNDGCDSVNCTGVGKEQPTSVSRVDLVAEYEHSCVSLKWSVEKTSNVAAFIIYRRTDAGQFQKIVRYDTFESGNRFTYLDCDVENTKTLQYTLSAVDPCGREEEIGTTSVKIERATSDRLVDLKTSPNPFNAATSISYFLTEPSRVTLTVYNTLGQKVDVLVDHHQRVGHHSISWNARGIPSGVYICRIQAGRSVVSGKMLLLR